MGCYAGRCLLTLNVQRLSLHQNIATRLPSDNLAVNVSEVLTPDIEPCWGTTLLRGIFRQKYIQTCWLIDWIYTQSVLA
jgi:hypothetical protein